MSEQKAVYHLTPCCPKCGTIIPLPPVARRIANEPFLAVCTRQGCGWSGEALAKISLDRLLTPVPR